MQLEKRTYCGKTIYFPLLQLEQTTREANELELERSELQEELSEMKRAAGIQEEDEGATEEEDSSQDSMGSDGEINEKKIKYWNVFL